VNRSSSLDNRTRSTTWCLPQGLRITLQGEPSFAYDTTVHMFELCETAARHDGLLLQLVGPETPGDAPQLPDWLAGKVTGLPQNHELTMVYGSGGRVGATLSKEGDLTCAWMEGDGSGLGLYVAKPHTGPFAIQTVLSPILRELFLLREAILVHGACVCRPDGAGILLIADGGGGKTTLALSLVISGARLLSDDLVVITCHRGCVAHAIPERMNLTRETLSLFPSLKHIHDQFDTLGATAHQGKNTRGKTQLIAHEVVRSDCMINTCPLQVVYRIRIHPGKPRVEPLPATELIGVLVRAHRFAHGQRLGSQAFAQLCEIVERVRAYTLFTGDDPIHVGRWLLERTDEAPNLAAGGQH
jgi:hypothetical protein